MPSGCDNRHVTRLLSIDTSQSSLVMVISYSSITTCHLSFISQARLFSLINKLVRYFFFPALFTMSYPLQTKCVSILRCKSWFNTCGLLRFWVLGSSWTSTQHTHCGAHILSSELQIHKHIHVWHLFIDNVTHSYVMSMTHSYVAAFILHVQFFWTPRIGVKSINVYFEAAHIVVSKFGS